jgi:hypothetical protein
MPRCPLCTTDPANPVFHRSMRTCPKRGALKTHRKVEVASPGPPTGGAGPPIATAKPIDETKETASSGEPKKGKKLLTFITRETQALRQDGAKPKQEFDWILPEEANARLWQAGLAFVRQTLNLFNKMIGIPPIPHEIMSFGKSDLDSINEALRAPTSKMLYTMGFRTVDQAVRFTMVFSGASLFGLMFVQIGLFYWEQVPKSQKFMEWRAKNRDRVIAQRKQREDRRLAISGGVPPAAGAPA